MRSALEFHLALNVCFAALECTGNVTQGMYRSLPTGSYTSNDISVTMVNVTGPWIATQHTCSIRLE